MSIYFYVLLWKFFLRKLPGPTEMQNVKSQIYYLTQTVLQLRGALKNTDVAVSSSSTTNDVPSLPSPVLTTTTSTGNNTYHIIYYYVS